MATMYNTAGYDPGAYLTSLKNIALQKYNQMMGASGAGADISLPTASQATNIASRYLGVLPNLQSSPEGLTSIYTGVPSGAKQQIMDTGFTGNKVFATPDIETARTYAIDSKNLRGTGLGKQTGDILEAQVPTSQVEDMLKKGALGTREIVLDPESASKVYQEGIGNIVESPSLGHKVFKTLSRTLPIAGGVLAAGDAYQRAQEGDYAGAALSGLGTLPVVGIPATLAQYATDALGLTGQEREEPQPITNIEVPSEVAQNVDVAVTAPWIADGRYYDLPDAPGGQPITNIEVPPEVAQNVDVSVTTPGYYDYEAGLQQFNPYYEETLPEGTIPIQVGSIFPGYYEDKEEFDRTNKGIYAGRPVYYAEGPDLPQGGLVYSGTLDDLKNFYSGIK